jgi:hypothetical protein
VRRSALTTAFVLVVAATPALALDLGRLLPTLELPSPPRSEPPASARPAPSPPATMRPETVSDDPTASSAPVQGAPGLADPALSVATTEPRKTRRERPRGWRGLLPGSLR